MAAIVYRRSAKLKIGILPLRDRSKKLLGVHKKRRLREFRAFGVKIFFLSPSESQKNMIIFGHVIFKLT